MSGLLIIMDTQIHKFTLFLLVSIGRFKFGINSHDLLSYIQSYYPYVFDPAAAYEAFELRLVDLGEKGLIEGNADRLWLSAKGREVIAEHDRLHKRDLVSFYAQCLRKSPPVASIQIINDSQTQAIIETIFSRKEHLRVRSILLDFCLNF